MAPGAATSDRIDAAIAKAAAPPVMVTGAIKLSTGRLVHLASPPNLTDAEYLELVAAIARDMRQTHREAAAPRSRLLVPR